MDSRVAGKRFFQQHRALQRVCTRLGFGEHYLVDLVVTVPFFTGGSNRLDHRATLESTELAVGIWFVLLRYRPACVTSLSQFACVPCRWFPSSMTGIACILRLFFVTNVTGFLLSYLAGLPRLWHTNGSERLSVDQPVATGESGSQTAR